MGKVLNFLFPGDIVKIKLSKKSIDELGISCPDNTITFMAYEVLYFPKNVISYTIYIKRFKDRLLGAIKISTDENWIKVRVSNYDRKVIVEEFMNLSIEDIIIRSGVINLGSGDYCRCLCSLRSVKVCKSIDKLCEYFNNMRTFLMIGDYISFKSKSFDKASHVGKIIGIGLKNDSKLEFKVVKSNGNLIYLRDKDDLELIKKKSLAVIINPCKLCILKSCNGCKVKLLNDLHFIGRGSNE